MDNIILKTDSYKLQHWKQYPKGTEKVYSYFESRRGAKYPYTVFFGLQYILCKSLVGQVVTRQGIEQAANLCKFHFGSEEAFNRAGWEHILKEHNGRLPLEIKAVPEGCLVPENNVMMTVENTDPKCAWLTNAVESLLTHVWYPSTVATLSHNVKGMIRRYLRKTGSDAGLNFMLHDFGYRGVSSDESAAIGGAAHLINFMGTDTLPAMLLLQEYYKVWDSEAYSDTFKDIAYSVPATEHSIMTSCGQEGEAQLVSQLIKDHPNGILSVVADSYDIYHFVSVIMGVYYKDRILARDGVFVVRPDSVTPTHTTPETQVLWIVNALLGIFGGTTNDKGYTVINPKVRVLWGDGIDPEGIEKILALLETHKFAAENMACFGMGGGLLQKVNRDTQRFAFKCSYQERDGVGYDIWKQPLDKSKASKKGKMKLVLQEGSHANVLVTVPIDDPRPDVMKTVFLNGELIARYGLTLVRANASEIYPPYEIV